ncbi:MAG: exodeoxyribonuclease VII small subunit [Clostridia bacterium]|nr:exodeoxyribonuclease VII small subunit [Clostridia bacterium]
MENIQNLSLEQAMDELEKISKTMESETSTVDQSVALYERGMALSEHCKKIIEGYKGRITALRNGEETPFEV